MIKDPGTAERLRAEIEGNAIVLFMDGTPVFPMCSPSAQAVHILGMLGVAYKSIDVMADPGMRPVLLEMSDWPTLPQLYVHGAFVGGADIMRELFQTGELQRLVG
jgi:monothiol glutaredoxin